MALEGSELENLDCLSNFKKASGRLSIVNDFNDIENLNEKDIAYITNSKNKNLNITFFYEIAKRNVSGIVCEEIGETNHGVILCQELKIPIFSVTGLEMREYENEKITIQEGSVFQGKKNLEPSSEIKVDDLNETNTGLKINLGFPEAISKNEKIPEISDGVGFMRMEFILLDALEGKHPHRYKASREELINRIASKIEPVLQFFNQSEVWIRSNDFSPSHLIDMEGGVEIEKSEENPMLGWRGISRSIESSQIFDIELEAIKKLVERGYDNIGVFPPMTRFSEEYTEWKSKFQNKGVENIKYGLMVETPSAALTFEEFVDDIEFMVFGSNDLTQFTLAIDRENPRLESKFDEKEKAVLRLMERVLNLCQENNIESCIGGTAGSDKELLKLLLDRGLDSTSVNPDKKTISDTRKFISEYEEDL